MNLLFLHGLESGPHGTKYQSLKKHFPQIISPDCTGVSDPERRLQIIIKCIEPMKDSFFVVGSSMGGLMALLLQQAIPERITGMVLCAPALMRPAASGLTANNLPPAVIIHGIQDTVVPIDSSRKFGLPLLEVEDDHSLRRSLPIIISETIKMYEKIDLS